MQSRSKNFSKHVYFILAFAVASYALSYYWHDDNPFSVRYHQLNSIGVYSHFIGAGLALLFGGLQIFTYPGSGLHRVFGYTYCLAVIIGGVGGCYLSFHAHLGIFTGLGFFIADILWLSFLFLAIHRVTKGDIRAHRRWMLRSMALTSAGITLRILLPLLDTFLTFDTSYIIVAWLSWIPNVIFMEIYLYVSSIRTSSFSPSESFVHAQSSKGI